MDKYGRIRNTPNKIKYYIRKSEKGAGVWSVRDIGISKRFTITFFLCLGIKIRMYGQVTRALLCSSLGAVYPKLKIMTQMRSVGLGWGVAQAHFCRHQPKCTNSQRGIMVRADLPYEL